MKKGLFITFLVIGILAIPALFKDRSGQLAEFEEPELAELTYEEVSFQNLESQLTLGGMIFLPENAVETTVIIIHGSGYSNRNNTWYLSLVDKLTRQGLAVLLPDKRGSNKSQGNWKGVSVEVLASDTHAAIDYVKSHPQLSETKIGLLGVSQGGWIAPVVSSQRSDLAFIVNMSGSTTTGDNQLLFEEKHNLGQYTYNFIAAPLSKLTTQSLKKKEHIAVFLDFDPMVYWHKIQAPGFIAYGENDTNCPVEQSITLIEKERPAKIQYRVYPNGRHGILSEDGKTISSAFLLDLRTFIDNN